jgi:hypothetical protein
MVLSPNTQEIALQSEYDIREFRNIFGRHGVIFGSPNNLSGFVRKLREDSNFAVDFWIVTRAIHLREKGYLTHEELFTLVVIAAAGPDLSSSNRKIKELLSEFHILLATRGENLHTEGRTKSDPLPSAVFPLGDHKVVRNDGTVDSRSNSVSTAQIYKGRNVALIIVLLSVTIAYVGSVIARSNQIGGAGRLGVASAHEKAINRSESQSAAIFNSSTVNRPLASTTDGLVRAADFSPAIVGDGSSNRGSGERGSFGKYLMSTRITNVTAEPHQSETPPSLHG